MVKNTEWAGCRQVSGLTQANSQTISLITSASCFINLEHLTWDSFKEAISKVLAGTSGWTDPFISANGVIVVSKDLVFSNTIPTPTREAIAMIDLTDLVFITGLMVTPISESGVAGSEMAMAGSRGSTKVFMKANSNII